MESQCNLGNVVLYGLEHDASLATQQNVELQGILMELNGKSK
jgi:hypothetical protein